MHLKTDKVDLKNSNGEKKVCIFLQSPYQVDMKNVVKCYKDFFPYFKALKTNCVFLQNIMLVKEMTYQLHKYSVCPKM